MNMTNLALLLAASIAGLCSCGFLGEDDPRVYPHGASVVLAQHGSIGAPEAKVELVPSVAGAVIIAVTQLTSAKAVYGEVRYDPAAMHIARITPADSGPDAVAQFGWVLPNFDRRAGVDGSIEIGSIAFAQGAAAQKVVLKAPTGPSNAIDITAELDASDRAHLTWRESLQGDGDNNGLVSISDLTPLGLSIGKTPGPGPADSQARDADYDKNGEVNISDITALALNLGTSLGGYIILSGPVADSLPDHDDFARSEMFTGTLNAASGELIWDWTDTAALAEDSYFQVVPYDNEGASNRGLASDAELLVAPNPTQTISDIAIALGPGITLDTDGSGDYIVILTENSVDATDGNAEALDGVLESLPLVANVDTIEDPGNIFDGTNLVVWRLIEGGGLAEVGNGGLAPKGLVTFINRGRIQVEAHARDNFALKDTIGIKLYSIQDIQLNATPGGAGPVNVASGDGVNFSATGIFDFDGIANGNEISADITPFVNWGMIPDETNAGSFSIDTGAAILGTADASSGDGVRVSAEFPTTAEVTLYDNMRKASNLVRVGIS
jgi:hypothetical protein